MNSHSMAALPLRRPQSVRDLAVGFLLARKQAWADDGGDPTPRQLSLQSYVIAVLTSFSFKSKLIMLACHSPESNFILTSSPKLNYQVNNQSIIQESTGSSLIMSFNESFISSDRGGEKKGMIHE